MERKNKLIIAIAIVSAIGILAVAWGTFLSGPDLSLGNKNILVLASDKNEQPGGGVDMAFMVKLENGSIKNYTPIYPGGKEHPTQPAPGNLQGKMRLHDSLWNGPKEGMQYAKEIVESNTGMHVDAVVVVYDEGLDAVIDSIRPLKIDGVETNLSATDIVRENDNYAGYKGRSSEITGTMSRGDSVMVLAKALSQAAADPDKRNKMVQTALSEYSKGNILMTPKGSFIGLMGTKGLENVV